MKVALFASAVALISGVYAQDFTINTPASLTVCQPVLIQWTGGTPPYFLSVYNSGSPSTNAETLTTTNSTSFTWTVNIAAGQSIGFNIVDNTGLQKQSAAVSIQSGSSTDCVGQSVSGSAGASTAAASTGSGSSTTGTGSSATATSAKSTGSSSSTSAAGSSTTSSSSNGASSQAAQLGAAGFIGAAIAALLS
ncbi:hypothetical protein J3R30DRAFT_3483083 [Lentinula aciculospora]|uniref:Uncharacterized protein n=1 Tax=Lentinula aciculospora TaxID=153920 RepID=A0A9W9DMC3_9AGAR|nr:hypothetical protein J3R30DRAFT_3483083 [Lentinula aciculospora]